MLGDTCNHRLHASCDHSSRSDQAHPVPSSFQGIGQTAPIKLQDGGQGKPRQFQIFRGALVLPPHTKLHYGHATYYYCCDDAECSIEICVSFVSDGKAAKLVVPREDAFDHPTMFASLTEISTPCLAMRGGHRFLIALKLREKGVRVLSYIPSKSPKCP